MGRLILFCVITAAFTGLTLGAGLIEDTVTAKEGENVIFTTSLAPAATPLHYIVWTFGTANIVTVVAGVTVTQPGYRDRITLFPLTGSLELRNLTERDSGEYGVNILATEDDTPIVETTTLNVIGPPSNVRLTPNDTDLVEFSDSVRLSCSASGFDLSFLGFTFNDSVEVTESDRVSFTDGGATVTISPVWRNDHGSYTCKVSNPVSNVTSNIINLNVNYGPEDLYLTPPTLDEYWEDTNVLLSCSADSRPPAQFKWFRNEDMLSYTGADITLVLKESGNYSCQAFNSKTLRYIASQPAPITVLMKIKNASVESSNHPVEGKSVNLTCDASGDRPIRKWMLNGTVLQLSDNTEFYEENRVLSFRVLTREDNGKYTCTISNAVSSQSADYEMKVNYGPDSVQISGPVEVKEGTKLTLICSADSVPTAKYTWTKNGTTVGQSPEFTKDKIGLSDGGEYICQATNDNTGKSLKESHRVIVTEKDVPSCPTGCIIGIVFGCIAAILLISCGVFYALKKKKQKPKSNTRTEGEGRDNSAYAQNQEVNYADVRFVKKDGAVVQLGVQNNTEYSEVRRNNNPPPAARLPTYNAHMQRSGRPAPEPPTEYAEVRPKRQ